MNKTLAFLLAVSVPVAADEDTFRERFADPETRAAAIAELVPGTRDAYFHTALQQQLTGKDADFRKTIAEWKAASKRTVNPVSTEGMSVLENRSLLLEYGRNPQRSLTDLIRGLDLKFDDARPNAAAAAAQLPTRLDPAWIGEDAFEKAAAATKPEEPYSQFRGQRLMRELEQVENFDVRKIRWFLANLDRTDLPGVVPLIVQSLGIKEPAIYDNLRFRKHLTSTQLTSLLELRPELRSNLGFACDYLTKLKPGAETDFKRDPAAHAEHLKRCRDFAITLPPALNSLKAHVLFHHLRLQLEQGNIPKDDLLTYLALPRQSHKLLRATERTDKAYVQTNVNFEDATGCPPIHDDQPIIEIYLNHFLGQTDSAADFVPFIQEKQLASIHAKARLLAGADTARWGTAIDPAEFKELQQEVSISFAPQSPHLLAANDAVALALDLKNTPDLLVRIYEIDQPAHLSRNDSEPDVNLDLDGLVPHHQKQLKFQQSPMVRHRESIDLPELSGSGVWLVDFVSGQVSARALIRKGNITPYVESAADRQFVRVFDEHGDPIQGAIVELGRETFTADTSGRIEIPDSGNQPLTEGIVKAGKLATAIQLATREEEPALQARFHLDREQLIADREARLQVRLNLSNRDHELPLDRIKDPALVMKAELLGDITTERVIAENLKLTPLMEIPFQVPADLLKLTLTLRGTVTPSTGGDPVKLSAEQVYELNGDLKSSVIGTLFATTSADGHWLEARGRNGEPLASREITVTCSRDGYQVPIKVQVRSDAKGRVELGSLEGISLLEAHASGIGNVRLNPSARRLGWAELMHAPKNTEIRLPLESPCAAPVRVRMSLLETLNDQSVRDQFDKLSIDDGDLLIRPLPPGDYQLTADQESMRIRISSDDRKGDLLVSGGRILPRHQPIAPSITSASVEGDQIVIKLRGQGPGTRVSLIGRRYQIPGWNPGEGLRPIAPPLSGIFTPGIVGCGYLTDRRLSDEVRYILDRRSAKIHPGSMLPRPGLLLNRWTEEGTQQEVVPGGAGAGGEGRGRPMASGIGSGAGGTGKLFGVIPTSEISCDFLNHPSVVRIDLVPEAKGTLEVPLADFANSQFIEITAADNFADDARILPLPSREVRTRDLRLARALDPKVHYQAARSAAVLAKDATASIENVLDADWRAFHTLEEVHQFLYGMLPDDRLREFLFLTEWPDLSDERKLERLSKHACHELHVFLFQKDRAFFDKHVKPLLSQKPEPTFIDDWLLQRDLTTYLRPYAWRRLNAAEKALLARAMPEAAKRISRELSQRWELERPSPEIETRLFTQTLRGTDLSTTDSLGLARNEEVPMGGGSESFGSSYISQKLRNIVIPRIDFEDTTVEEAIDFLRMRAAEMDTLELDPSKKGINFVVRRPRTRPSPDDPSGATLPGATTDPGSLRIHELRLRNVPLNEALKYICEQTKLRFRADDYAVTLVPQTETGEDVYTRTFRVPPDFMEKLSSDGGGGDNDPFAEPSNTGSKLSARMPVSELLKQAGIAFPEGTSASLTSKGVLLVTNNPTQLDMVAQLVDELGSSRTGADAGLLSALADLPDLPPIDDPARRPVIPRKPISLPRFPEHTKLWREADYYHNIQPADERLIPLNRFWLDLAAWDGKGAFLSANFNACHNSANEALMCLALLDLPFKADRPEVAADGGRLNVKAKSPMLLFYKDTRKADEVAKESPLLARQSFSPLAEKTRVVDGRQVENPVTGEFRTGVPYAMSLVVTNPTGIGRRLDVLAQIPAGSIPLEGNPSTFSTPREIQPHGVLKLELAFYFPAAGDFAVYPLHVSENGVVLASTAARTLRVTNEAESLDAASWLAVAADGTGDAVLNRLRTENLKTIDLTAIRWRLKDRAFFGKVMDILRDRLHLAPELAAYGFLHNDAAAIREYLEGSPFASRLGDWFDSPLIDIRPRVHHDWRTLEFDPLVNPRAHRFTGASRLTDEAARTHYHAFLDQLKWKPALDDSDQLTLTAFLFLQDRIEEALARFAKIRPEKLPGRVNYDYLKAVALFYQEKPVEAKTLAAGWLATLPTGVWRDRFQTVVDQAAEIAALANPAKARRIDNADPTPHIELAASDQGGVLLKHAGLEKATLRLFSVDLEMLFSKDPFLTGGEASEPSIRPNEVIDVTLAKDAGETTVELPESLRQGNVLVSAASGETRLLKVLDSRALELRQVPQDRVVQVMDAATGKPLPRTYIKVYAENRNGEVVFHKDGYTDLRGKFDYLSHTAVDLSTVDRVALLASHPEKGAKTAIYKR